MNRRSSRSAALGVLTGTAVVLALVACGGSGAGGNEASPAATPSTAAQPSAGDSATAELAEFTITVSQSTFDPGSYTFSVENAGGVDHALEIEGPGAEVETGLIAPGDAAELAVTFENGTYELYCPVPGHREQGMELELAVGSDSAVTEPPATTTTGDDDGYRY